MPWTKTPEDRRRDAKVYQDPAYIANRALARERSRGRCEKCGRRTRLQCDHIIPVTQGGSHALSNLQMLCTGTGSCHARKTAQEGGGYRKPRTDPEFTPRTRW